MLFQYPPPLLSFFGPKIPRSQVAKDEVVGLLMMAAIPIRTAGLERSTSRTNWTYSAYPSREAAAAGHRNAINLAMSGETESYPTLPSEFYNQVLDTGRMNSGFTQLDYLELALSVVIRVIRYAPAYFSWVGEIIQAYHVLLADRQRIQQQLPGAHHTRWAIKLVFQGSNVRHTFWPF